MSNGEIVWIYSEKCYGEIIKYGAFYSLVAYTKDKTRFEVYLENEEFSVMEDVTYPDFWEEEEN